MNLELISFRYNSESEFVLLSMFILEDDWFGSSFISIFFFDINEDIELVYYDWIGFIKDKNLFFFFVFSKFVKNCILNLFILFNKKYCSSSDLKGGKLLFESKISNRWIRIFMEFSVDFNYSDDFIFIFIV